MAAVSATINGVSFVPLDNADAGTYLMDWDVGAPVSDLAEYHPPGNTGTAIVDNGEAKRPLAMRLRYVGAADTIASDYINHCTAWRAEITITLAGRTFARCRLVSASKPPARTKTTNVAAMDAAVAFVCFGGVS